MSNFQDLKQYLIKNYPPGTAKINFGSQYQIREGSAGIAILVQYLKWDIEFLNISQHSAGDKGMQILLTSQMRPEATWGKLRELVCTNNEITNDGLRGIQRVQWACLEGLSLNDNKIDHFGMAILARTNFSSTLKKLFLGGNRIGIGGCEVLSKTDWPCFQRLGLNYNFITNEGLAFLQLAHWPKMLQINLSNNKLDSRGMIYLENANWPLLQILILSRNKIGLQNETQLTDMGCYHLSRMPTRSMKNLGLFGNEISLNGIRMILRSGIHQPNCFLELFKNKFTYQEIRPYLQQYDLFCNEFQD